MQYSARILNALVMTELILQLLFNCGLSYEHKTRYCVNGVVGLRLVICGAISR